MLILSNRSPWAAHRRAVQGERCAREQAHRPNGSSGSVPAEGAAHRSRRGEGAGEQDEPRRAIRAACPAALEVDPIRRTRLGNARRWRNARHRRNGRSSGGNNRPGFAQELAGRLVPAPDRRQSTAGPRRRHRRLALSLLLTAVDAVRELELFFAASSTRTSTGKACCEARTCRRYAPSAPRRRGRSSPQAALRRWTKSTSSTASGASRQRADGR